MSLVSEPPSWDRIYAEKGASGVSWFQAEANQSLALISGLPVGVEGSLIDIGGGASTLVDGLLDRGFTDVTVLELAEAAVQQSRDRLGPRAAIPVWVHGDVLDWHPARAFDLWHDRAVFHFLTEETDRERYRATLLAATHSGSYLVIGTFAADGATECSGRPVRRYRAEELAGEFDGWDLVAQAREDHLTPWGSRQPFTWVVLLRKG